MNTDEHHDNAYEDTGEIASVRAHVAYADWRGPDFDCVICGGEPMPLGQLGRREYFRCRDCGLVQSPSREVTAA